MKTSSFLYLLVVSCFFSCEEEKPQEIPNWDNQKSIDLHKGLSEEEDLDIRTFLAHRKELSIEETGTGLRFALIKKGNGQQVSVNDVVKVSYSIQLLDGKVCYKTSKDELDLFTVDHSEMESGIHEGIKKMHVGDKALMVFPSNLAHGLIGNLEKIPPLAPLAVEIELIEIKK